MTNPIRAVYEFAEFQFDVHRMRLSYQGEPLLLPPKALTLLLVLLQRAGQIIEREELLRAVWGDTFIEDANLTVAISTLRKALQRNGTPPLIETIPRLGYRFTASVRHDEKTPLQLRTPVAVNATQIVGREKELTLLREGVATARNGRGLLLCLAGEPGIGKTTVVENFLTSLASVQIAHGRCAERLAGTEAYLPILEILAALSQQQGENAPLLQEVAPAWHAQINAPAGDAAGNGAPTMVSQERLKRELLAFMRAITRAQPLVLFFDDLHWADASTVDALAYLAANFAVLPVLIIVTYRPTELQLTKHPFALLKPDLQARGSCRELNLGFLSEAEITAYLALEFSPHDFPPDFPALLHARTEGSPLFLVDLLQHLRARGVLLKKAGQWCLAQSLPTIEHDLPESVRGMIERKITQLSAEDRYLLNAASTQGAEFDSAVLARALNLAPDAVEERLQTLERVNDFVRLLNEDEFPTQVVTLRYRFVHALYQNALYDALPPTRRATLSAAIAQTLEALYGEQHGRVAALLGNLHEAAREYARAADYFLQAAGNAARLNAHREAITLAHRGLTAVQKLPASLERDQRELGLLLALGLSSQVVENWAAPATNDAFTRAYALYNRLGEDPRLFTALYGIWVYRMICSEYAMAETLVEQLLQMAGKAGEPALQMAAHIAAGSTGYYQGKFLAARAQQETALTYHNPAQHAAYLAILSEDLGVTVRRDLSWGLWTLGYPDQALAQVHEGLRLANQAAHPFSQSAGLYTLATLHLFRREWRLAADAVRAMNELIERHDLGQMAFFSTSIYSITIAHQGQLQEGIAGVQQFLAGMRASGFGMWTTGYLAHLAELYLLSDQIAEGVALITEAETTMARSGERHFAAELQRLKGELYVRQDAPEKAAVCFQQAIAMAQEQRAKSWELRAAISLARLWQRQRRFLAAEELLSRIYCQFTEGFHTLDLQEAKSLQETLQRSHTKTQDESVSIEIGTT